jgi:hypothetical protein
LDLDPDPMDLMDLDLDLDPIHPSLTLIVDSRFPVFAYMCLPLSVVQTISLLVIS